VYIWAITASSRAFLCSVVVFSTLYHQYQRYHRGSSDIPIYNSAACEISITFLHAFILLNEGCDGGPLLGFTCCNIWLPNRVMRQKLLSERISPSESDYSCRQCPTNHLNLSLSLSSTCHILTNWKYAIALTYFGHFSPSA
jgi:hypothetical protein